MNIYILKSTIVLKNKILQRISKPSKSFNSVHILTSILLPLGLYTIKEQRT